MIRARRSTGSILKPFLFASMLDDGEILPQTLVPDIPTYYGNYNPQNYNRTFDGAVPAKMALARSLNIPAIRMLSGSQKIEASGAVKLSPPPSIPRAMMLTRLSFEWSGPGGRFG